MRENPQLGEWMRIAFGAAAEAERAAPGVPKVLFPENARDAVRAALAPEPEPEWTDPGTWPDGATVELNTGVRGVTVWNVAMGHQSFRAHGTQWHPPTEILTSLGIQGRVVDPPKPAEPEYIPGHLYEDTEGKGWLRGTDSRWPWIDVLLRAKQGGTGASFGEHAPARPLTQVWPRPETHPTEGADHA